MRENKDKLMKLIRLKLLKKWGRFSPGDEYDFGHAKAVPLIKKGVAVEIEAKGPLKPWVKGKPKPMELVRLKLLKKWGRFKPGDEYDFGYTKAQSLIESGTAIDIKAKPKPEVKPEPKPEPTEKAEDQEVCEKATVDPVWTPRRRGRPRKTED